MIEVCGIVVGTLVVTFLALPWVFKLYMLIRLTPTGTR